MGATSTMTMDHYAKGNRMETPIMNQAEIMGVLKVEFSRARRYGSPLSCVLIQIDRYEYLRDLYGVEVTNSISENIIHLINNNTRLSDFLGKIGERFLLIMPHTDIAGATVFANRIKQKLSLLDFDISGKLIKVTLSIGIADNSDEESIFYDSILRRAEFSLKEVIDRGGNGIGAQQPTD